MFCPQNPTLTSLELSPDFGCEKPVANHLTCDTVNILYTQRENGTDV
jgi:hypothetical protein